MAAPTTTGLTPAEAAFLAEHELIEVIPRQRLGSIPLLGGSTTPLAPPRRASVPLWLALLLKRQQRANISVPAWLRVDALSRILELETSLGPERGFTRSVALPPSSASGINDVPISHPFIPYSSSSSGNITSAGAAGRAPLSSITSTALDRYADDAAGAVSDDGHGAESSSGLLTAALPYHWLEIATLVLGSAADDVPEADTVRRLVRDVREARAAKVRGGIMPQLDGGREARVNGIGALEVAEHRLFIIGVLDGLRKIGSSKETSRREREEEDGNNAGGAGADDSDDDMSL